MPQLSSTPHTGAHQPVRDRGDACPGALRLHSADDGALARVRVPGGALTVGQAVAVADLADELGDGRLDVTSRGNLQLRGLPADCGGQLAARLGAVGLLPAPRHERVRNITASPLSGVDGCGSGDVRPWVGELDELLCGSPSAVRLSGRFLFAFDDGRGDVTGLGADVTVCALPSGEALLRTGDGPAAVRVVAGAAPRAAALAAETFLAAALESNSGCWRVAELPPQHSPLAGRVAEVLAQRGLSAGWLPEVECPSFPSGEPPVPGLVPNPAGDRQALSVQAPLGRLATTQWRLLAQAAEDGTDGLRVTPWRGVVVTGLPSDTAAGWLAALDSAGLVTRDDSRWRGVGACTGLPGCGKAHRDVRADAAAARTAGPGLLPVYWSGCERRCGHPRGDWVDVTADAGGYTVSVRGTDPSGPHRVPGERLADAVTAARTPGPRSGESRDG